MASVLELGDLIKWLRSFGDEELESEEEDMNRLYQLLIEVQLINGATAKMSCKVKLSHCVIYFTSQIT